MCAAKLARERCTDRLMNELLPHTRFTERPNESVLCLMCNNVLRYPMQLSCGHRVCRSCNDSKIPADNNGVKYCPNDGEVIERAFPDTSALKEIMNLYCYCVSNEDGCGWQGPVLDLEHHVSVCESSVATPCPFQPLHCAFKGNANRLTRHMREERLLHDCLVVVFLQQYMNNNKENKNILDHIVHHSPLHPVSFLDIEEELQAVVQEVDRQTKSLHSLQQKFSITEQLVKKSTIKKNIFNQFYENFNALVQKIEDQVKTLDVSDEQREAERRDATRTKTSTVDKVKRLQDTNTSQSKQINEIGVKIRIAQCSSHDGTFTWKLDNLRSRMSEAQKGKVRELYTPPLFTSLHGYKFSAKVMLPGDRTTMYQGVSYLGVYIVVMQGDYDEILHFPFPYPIEITLRNFTNRAAITHTLYPDPQKPHFDKPIKNMNPAIGFARFCPIEKLKNEGFVKNDTIYFNIEVKKNGVNVNELDV